MTRTQEARLRSELKETNALSLLDVTEQEAVQEILSQLGAWVRSPQRTEGDSATFQVPGGRLLGLIAQREAGRAFKNVEARSSPTDVRVGIASMFLLLLDPLPPSLFDSGVPFRHLSRLIPPPRL